VSWYSRTWAACTWRSCDKEILRTRALDQGWHLKDEGGWLCPVHRPDRPQYDVRSRASGEREND
jgi:hypothetical protein